MRNNLFIFGVASMLVAFASANAISQETPSETAPNTSPDVSALVQRFQKRAAREHEMLFSTDTKAARKSVDFFVEQESPDILCQVLLKGKAYQRLGTKSYAAEKLRPIATQATLMDLITALKKHNVPFSGSSEINIAREMVADNLVEAISTITGLSFEKKAAHWSDKMKRIDSFIEESESWLKVRKKKKGTDPKK